MNPPTLLIFLFSTLIFWQGCRNSDSDEIRPRRPSATSPDFDGWAVPKDQVLDGGPGKDGIPSIDDPKFIPVGDVNFLSDEKLVLVATQDGMIKVYPHDILDWHEIVNDRIGSRDVAITYCPLTGTGIGWDRLIEGSITTFGVSGLLYNSNLMPYDRNTGSTWSQQLLDCVHGDLKGKHAITLSLLEMPFGLLVNTSNALVLSTETGFDRDYGRYPYFDYRENHENLIFPVSTIDNRLPAKERTLGVLNLEGKNKVYPFSDEGGLQYIFEVVGNKEIVVVCDKERNYLTAFQNDRHLIPSDQAWPIVLADGDGNHYDFLGLPINVSDVSPLSKPQQFIGYWFSWGTFYPGIELHRW